MRHGAQLVTVIDYHLLHVAVRRHPWTAIYWTPISSIEPA